MKKAKLEHELERLLQLREAFAAVQAQRLALLERIRMDASIIRLSFEDVRDKSQRSILHLLAERNDGWLVLGEAIRAMKEVNIFGNEANASGQIATALRRSPEFEQVARGIYRLSIEVVGDQSLEPVPGPPPTSIRHRQATNAGLSKAVEELRSIRPEWTREQVTEELLEKGWDFQGKKPYYAVSAVFAHQARKQKSASRSLFGLLATN